MEGLIVYYSIGVVAVFFSAFLACWVSTRFNITLHRGILITLIFASGYIFFAQYLKYKSLHMYVDFAHWLQLLQSIATKGWPEVLSQEFISPGTRNYFAAHFVPLIYLFAIPFKLFPYPATLIVLNVALMLSSAIPLYKLAVLRSGDRKFGLFIAALLLWYPTFQYITMYEFEMLRFSIPVLLWMLYFWERKKIGWYFLFVLLATLVREEVGLTVGMFGIYLLFVEKKKVYGFCTFLIGFAVFGIITQMVMPFFSTASDFKHIAIGSFAQFGGTPIEILKGIFMHPILFLETIFHSIKFANIGMLFLPLLFIPLLAPMALVSILANIGVGLVSDSLVHTSYMLYYIAPSVPFIFYALMKGWSNLIHVIARERSDRGDLKPSGEIAASLTSFAPRNDRIEGALMYALLVAIIFSNIFFGPSPISVQFWFKDIRPAPFRTQAFHWSVYHVTEHHKKAEEFVRMIPDDAIVSAQQFLQPRLYQKRGMMIFPELQSKDKQWQAEYVFFDVTNNGLKSESPAYITKEEMAIVQESKQWERIAAEDGYELYKKI